VFHHPTRLITGKGTPPMRATTNIITTSTRRSAMRFSAVANADAELIALCQTFTEATLDAWWAYMVDDDADEPEPKWDDYRRIVTTPATTSAGWHAKALALTAWNRDAFDDLAEDPDSFTTGLSSLMRDMVAPARAAIMACCAAKYGPLPGYYSTDGLWVGPTQEEEAERNKMLAERDEARIAAVVAEHRGTRPPVTNVPGQELIGVDEAGNMSLWATGTIKPLSALENNASSPAYIDGGHYVIWWKGHAITVHLSGSRTGLLEVLFMCGNLMKANLLCDEVEALLIGKVSEDGDGTPDYWAERIKEVAKHLREAMIAEAPGRRRGHISEGVAA
jgi:hypothetical protein